ncbi:uncharacterized protein ELE39_001234 [Cryptosporidium sp. chipmunk genotype I]|uniref:uncharacterized protein n=1 Tax=Cryptosporidium sp. chipmunk genotype I TaxID=1280935 RepID=UPI00351A4D6E|nr:hypothetical protein ELE39_001234 [Cryptosporidium sp. chipmunk genotype I]
MSLKSTILSKNRVNSSNYGEIEFRVESILHESILDMQVTELICNEPLNVKMQIEILMERINFKNTDFANFMAEKIKTTLKDSLKTMLINCEDLKTLEVNSIILKENSYQLFKSALRDNRDIKKNVRNFLLASTVITAMLLLLIK